MANVSMRVNGFLRLLTAWQTDTTDEPALDEQTLPIYVASTGTSKGKGAYASRDLAKGEFVGEYSGQILCEDQIEGTSRAESAYLFDLGDGLVVDAERMGNATRRMMWNHNAGSPNVSSTVVNHRGVRKVCMHANVHVKKGTELTFDYGKLFTKRFAPVRP